MYNLIWSYNNIAKQAQNIIFLMILKLRFRKVK